MDTCPFCYGAHVLSACPNIDPEQLDSAHEDDAMFICPECEEEMLYWQKDDHGTAANGERYKASGVEHE